MGKDSEIAEMGRDMKYVRTRRRQLYGVNCPKCIELQPRRSPTILLPQQRCKVDGYRDPRPRISQEQEDAIWAERGYTRSPPNG